MSAARFAAAIAAGLALAGPGAAPAAEPAQSGPPAAVDHLDLDTSSIRGNRELPKVLYIVPWKDPRLGDLLGRPVNSLVDEVLAPVDRDVFLRQTRYFEQLYGNPESAAE